MTTIISCFDLFAKIATDLRASWVYWDELFYDGSFGKRVEKVAKQVAPRLFSHIRFALLVTVVNDLAKLGDPTEQHGRKNLTLESVYGEVSPLASDRDGNALRSAMRSAHSVIQSKDFRDFRNRILFHNDLQTALGKEDHDIEFDRVRRAVSAIADFCVRAQAIVGGQPKEGASDENYWLPSTADDPLREDATRFVEALERGASSR